MNRTLDGFRDRIERLRMDARKEVADKYAALARHMK